MMQFPIAEIIHTEADRRWITNMKGHLPFLADLIPADLFICCPRNDGQLMVVAEAKPTIRESFYRRSLIGYVLPVDIAAIYQAFRSGEITEGPSGKVVHGQPLHQMVYPMRRGRHICGVIVVERNLYEELKHTNEKRSLCRTAISRAVLTLINKTRMLDTPLPSPILPGDATLLLNSSDIIVHAGHQAMLLARRFGLPEAIEGLAWQSTFPSCGEIRVVTSSGIFDTLELVGRKIILAICILPLDPADETVALIAILRDITELREKDRELAVKETIIREVHHRVKNNLQTIAGLLRLQMRRTNLPEVKVILSDCIDRIASIALVHEYLSHDDVGVVDLKDLAGNLLSAAMQGLASPDIRIKARVMSPGERLTLPSAKATSTALVVNELLQNTCKHAFRGRPAGQIDLILAVAEGELVITIKDDGIGLPLDFEPEGRGGHLGWQIVRTLVRDDLRGTLKIDSSSTGTTVTVAIPLKECY
ncbi:MAG: sensor histidine kinase [Cyanobacteria bacterium NC_groundwater_1444_Ag_S-0.65um_54_12]|nr:sensor histidine kinase [Cyanobacteria bacterium NC_groundwater_1444_Ag_S-0.65um_54_12]